MPRLRDRNALRAGLALGAWALLVAGLAATAVAAVLRAEGVTVPGQLLWMLLGIAAASGLLMAGGTWWWLNRYPRLLPRLIHALDILREVNPSLRLHRSVPRPLARAVNALADHYQTRLGTVEQEIADATSQLAAERDLLAALLGQLREALVVCSSDGRILLYNPPARELLGGDEGNRGGIGLGRSLFSLFRRSMIVHCLDRLAEVSGQEGAEAVRALINTRDGRLLRASFSPIRQGDLSGFCLTLAAHDDPPAGSGENPGDDGQLHALQRLTHIRAAIETLRDFPDMPAERHGEFLAIIDDESAALGSELQRRLAQQHQREAERWPLEEVAAETFLDLLRRRAAPEDGGDIAVQVEDASLWLRADTYAMALSVRFLVRRLRQHCDAGAFRLRLQRDPAQPEARLMLDLLWAGKALAPGQWQQWESTPVQRGSAALPFTLADIARQHGGELWPQQGDGEQLVRWLLPRTAAPAQHAATAVETTPARPEFYDFNLFAATATDHHRDDLLLRDLTCTAFDTETTGLNPMGGDEIIAIGAIRIVRGRMLSQEVFETLVGSRRPIHPQSRKVHGISQAMLADAPAPETALHAFRDFCEDSVLVGHNAAFDLSFLSRQGRELDLRFEQPVLDTLLLSAVLYPEREAHQLEAIAERLGVSVVGRHTALGDAIVAGEVFIRLIPLLEARGIETLGQALTASRKTWYARLEY